MRRVHQVAMEGFSARPKEYELLRPSYPPAAMDFVRTHILVGRNNCNRRCVRKKVLDLAAGTGKLTRLLSQMTPSLDLVAVEPNEGMLSEFQKNLPNIRVHQAEASSLPFPSQEFDAVFIGQAFHWFADEPSIKEIARVLKPWCPLVCVWNLEDLSVPWAKDVFDAVTHYDADVPQYHKGKWREVFGTSSGKLLFPDGPVCKFFPHTLPRSPAELWEMNQTKSYISCLPAQERTKLKAELEAILVRHRTNGGLEFQRTDTDETERVALPLLCEVAIARKALGI
eukprot:gb/GEZN01013752.1/.p1 GENE.gb/GEZN01013752.1/~~gb/GEZN01013752.1/.p1  ORF type:complete len:283 (+),score=44.63 gb/GEZN01013752.1/:112-960(+)